MYTDSFMNSPPSLIKPMNDLDYIARCSLASHILCVKAITLVYPVPEGLLVNFTFHERGASMKYSKRSLLLHSTRSERGAGFMEYVLLAALIAVVCIAGVRVIGTTVSDSFTDSTTDMFFDPEESE